MGRFSLISSSLLIIVFTTLINANAHAYINTLTSSGILVRWKYPFKLNLVGNYINQSGLSPSQIWDAAVTSLQRWKSASDGGVDFDYWQGNTQDSFPSNSELNKISSLYFISNSKPRTEMPSNVLGITQVWYKVETGQIMETDIALNDHNFNFTNNPRDTSGYGGDKAQLIDGKLNVYLQNVIAHELGHALGLSHSAALQSTMLFMESPEQAYLSCDELIGIHATYPTSDNESRGGIHGIVLSNSGNPILGAHVLAISQRRGTVLAGALSDSSGRYHLDALEPGIYYLMVEPYYAGTQALPTYYTEMNHSLCNEGTHGDGPGFERNFLVKKTDLSQPQAIRVFENKITNPPNFEIRCPKVAVVQDSHTPTSSPKTIPIASDSSSGPYFGPNFGPYFGMTDKIGQNNTNTYELPQISGNLEIHALAYSLYSPLHVSMTLYSPDFSMINSQIVDPVYTGESGYKNYDSILIANHLTKGNYILQVTGEILTANDYPAGPISLDNTPFLLITGSLNNTYLPLNLPLEGVLPNNSRCHNFNEKFLPYTNPSEAPSRPQPTSKHESGSCGAPHTRNPSTTERHLEGNSQQKLGDILGWFLPWIFILSRYRSLHRNLNRRFSC